MRQLVVPPALCLTVCLLSLCAAAQESLQRDPQAILLLTQAVAAMGGNAPGSSLATGTIDLVEGSLQETGTIRIVTRRLEEVREEIQTNRGLRARIYANGVAARVRGFEQERLSLEMAASSRSPNFPLPLLVAALNDIDSAFEYVGQESLDGVTVHHIRFWNTHASNLRLQHLAEFSLKDLWIDAASGLPTKLSYDQREGGGATPRIRVGASCSDYRDVGGVLYPFLIERIYNGTPWAGPSGGRVEDFDGLSGEDANLHFHRNRDTTRLSAS